MSKAEAFESLRALAVHDPPERIWISLPCDPWSSIQRIFERTLEQSLALAKKRQNSRRMAARTSTLVIAVLQDNACTQVCTEWPRFCSGWDIAA